MGAHEAKRDVPRQDRAVLHIQLQFVFDKEVRNRMPAHERHDATSVVRLLEKQFHEGKIDFDQLLDLCDDMVTQVGR